MTEEARSLRRTFAFDANGSKLRTGDKATHTVTEKLYLVESVYCGGLGIVASPCSGGDSRTISPCKLVKVAA